MDKAINRIILKCTFFSLIIYIPFLILHYFAINFMLENGRYFFRDDELLLDIILTIIITITGIIIGKKSRNTVTNNDKIFRKYFVCSVVVFLTVIIIGFTGIYRGIYFTITYSIAAIEKSPLLIQVCWEQILNGKFFKLYCVY